MSYECKPSPLLDNGFRLYNLDKHQQVYGNSRAMLDMLYDIEMMPILELFDTNYESSWAEDRVIVLGDDVDLFHELPEGVLSHEQVEQLLEDYSDNLEDVPGEWVVVQVPKSNLYKDYSQYVLRNFSKKQYVRGDGQPDNIRGMSTLRQSLFIRLFWTMDTCANACFPNGVPSVSKGSWAGDRFNLMLFKDVKEELAKEGWVDVTDEVKGHVEQSFRKHEVDLPSDIDVLTTPDEGE